MNTSRSVIAIASSFSFGKSNGNFGFFSGLRERNATYSFSS